MKIYDWQPDLIPPAFASPWPRRTCSRRVRFVSVDLWKGEHKKPEFLARNYSGTLPVLELDDGTFIAECTAITEYLDALEGAPDTHRQDGRAKRA